MSRILTMPLNAKCKASWHSVDMELECVSYKNFAKWHVNPNRSVVDPLERKPNNKKWRRAN